MSGRTGLNGEPTMATQASDRRTLLVVEDDGWTRRLLSELFADEGYRVLQTDSGTDGLQLARQQTPDVMLLDLVLPDMSGVEVLRDLSTEGIEGTIPVIVISGEVDEPAPQALMDELRHARCIIEKPLDIGRLFDEVENAAAPHPVEGG